ncbi:aldehyde dehydrogenase family protein [Nonomuraea sp. NPDC046570]|uniref:aldehyde dehydrogenase family protein n=1 Tax=Nonomuraea sp. NPDC046570 TaxID=3155255 RepID=UPI0034015F45
MPSYENSPFIDGAFVSTSGTSMQVISPADATVVATVAAATREDLDSALRAARHAQRAWSRTSLRHRMEVMLRVATLIERSAEELARIVVSEVGKPITEARGEVQGAIRYFTYFAHLLDGVTDEIVPRTAESEEIWIRRVPHGVVGAIIPWNYPAALTARKVAPAIAAGNAVVLKPHEQTPLSSLYLAALFAEAGVPDGLVNVVPGAGPDIGQALVTHPETDLVTMTGSVRAGRSILRDAAERITPVSLELGGKAPLIVLADADVAAAAKAAVESRFANAGQVCISAERVYVHESRHAEFVDALRAEVAGLRVGDPMDPATRLGPKVTEAERDKVEAMLAAALESGAELLAGGGRPEGEGFARGWWMNPAVLGSVTDDMPIMRQEIFGPVMPLTSFTDTADVVRRANDSEYGLSAYLFTNDFRQVMRLVDDLRFGEVYVNRIGPEDVAGYHSGFRRSGLGGDDGRHGLDFYWQRQTVYVNWA